MKIAKLLAEYCRIGVEPPSWAYPLAPSIPFVGKHYGRWGGILVYASAENLSQYERKPEIIPSYLKDERRFNRHRAAFECSSEGRRFKNVHMAPFDNGSLIVATGFYVWRRFQAVLTTPKELLESIAAANFCKFSIAVGAKGANKDYAGGPLVLASLPYVIADLEVLQPSVVILPRSILKQPTVLERLVTASPNTEFVPVYQFNSTVVNSHLKKHAAQAAQLQEQLRGTHLAGWIDHLSGYRSGYPYRYLAAMDQVLSTSDLGR